MMAIIFLILTVNPSESGFIIYLCSVLCTPTVAY